MHLYIKIPLDKTEQTCYNTKTEQMFRKYVWNESSHRGEKSLDLQAQNYVDRKGINEGRIVLHSDLNNFFASVECLKRPDLEGRPVAVCGSREDRHGIVLAKNEIAKKCGVKTAEAIWQAKSKCADLVILPPNYDEYVRYSRMVSAIYLEYSDMVEGFGMDEAWIELTGDYRINSLERARFTAEEIRKRVKEKTGLTVSIGVSDNKIFSKLASDYKKPDAVTVFGPHNYKELVCGLDIGDMIFIGRNAKSKLSLFGIETIGNVAGTSLAFMKRIFGKVGENMFLNAVGANTSRVARWGESPEEKSIGNSVTLPYDLENKEAVKSVFCALAEKVAYRLRSKGFAARTVCISVRSTSLATSERQCRMDATSNAVEIARAAMELYKESFDVSKPVRSVGIRTTNLVSMKADEQVSMFDTSFLRREKLSKIDVATDKIREKYGMEAITHVSAMKIMVSDHGMTSFAHGRV